MKKEISELHSVVDALIKSIQNGQQYDNVKQDVATMDVGTLDWNKITVTSEFQGEKIGRYYQENYPMVRLQSGLGIPDEHYHDIICDWTCFVDLMEGRIVTETSEDWDGHSHVFTFKLGANGHPEFIGCDSCDNDPHSSVNNDPLNPAVFTVPIN